MNRPLSNGKTGRAQWIAGAIFVAFIGFALVAGGETSTKISTKQKWLRFFFDGVPDPNAKTNQPAIQYDEDGKPLAVTQAPQINLTPTNKIVFTSHPPYDDHQCTECHKSKYSPELKAPQKEVCFTCHDDFLEKAKSKHQPVDNGECASCHDPHGSPFPKMVKKIGKELCADCHDDFSKKFKHTPVENGECNSCHNPHGTANDKLMLKPDGKLCFECHDEFEKQFIKLKVKHQPVENGECVSCHNPHDSDFAKLLLKPDGKLCFECHEDLEQQLAKAKVKHQPVENGECASCHNPHASEFSKLTIKQDAKLCFECHEDFEKKLATAPVKHQPVENGECNSCHNPHLSEFPKLTLKQDAKLCFECHEDFEQKLQKAAFKHDPVGNGDCATCHDPHQSLEKGLLKLSPQKTCSECHEEADIAKSKAHLNLGQQSCSACHDPHFGGDKFFLETGSVEGASHPTRASMKTSPKKYWLWIALFCFGYCESALAQTRARRIEEPRWMTLNISESSVGVFAEGTFEETTFGKSGQTITHNHLFVGPGVGLNMNGSIYHPNLFRFLVNTEGAYGWGQDSVESPGSSMTRGMWEYLGRFDGTVDIFGNKPLNGRIFGNYDHTYRDYDFFNRVTVDSFRYGGELNYSLDRLTTSLGYSHQEEEASGIASGMMHSESDVVTMFARHDRDKGASTLNYTYSQYTRGDFGMTGTGNDHTVSASDSERFGGRDQFRLNSGASYSRRDSFGLPNDDVTANADLVADHSPNLSSYYDAGYNRYSSGRFSSDNYTGRAQLRHQLYESLTSTLIAQGSDNEFSDSISSGYVRRFGGGFAETYTKQIGDDHRLRINTSLLAEHIDQDSVSTVENESHVFSGSVGGSGFSSFFLTLPQVIELTIVVTDQNDTAPPFVRGIDFDVRALGSRTIIERLPGSRIPDGSTVLVDYETERIGAGSYESLTEVFQVRFDLWKNFWGLYARLNLYTHNAPEELHVQSLTSYAFGTDVTWRWLRAGAEYEIYDSDQSDYNALRLFQSFSFRPDDASTIGFEFSEAWANYTDAHRQEENFRFITLYHRNLLSRLRLDFDGGIHLRRGRDVDQTLATARPSIEYGIGSTTIRVGYDFEYQLFLNQEERIKHLLFLRIKRVF